MDRIHFCCVGAVVGLVASLTPAGGPCCLWCRACRACGLYLAPMATMTAQRPRGGLSSASASSAPASSSSSSRPLPAAPEALPLLSHDLHNGVEEQLLGELEQEIMGPGDNAGTYYLPSPPRSAPRWAGDAGSSAAAAQVGESRVPGLHCWLHRSFQDMIV